MIQLLKGIRVLECALLVQGDHTARLLGDMGADVIKIEMPGIGDYIRDIAGEVTPRHSPGHLLHNRNKRSLTLNLRDAEGKRIFHQLLKTADIFVDGFAGDACTRLGIGIEDQRKIKPDIIYCQSSGFGSRGRFAQLPVHGYMMLGQAGALTVGVSADGSVQEVPDRNGRSSGAISPPVLGALYAAMTAAAALGYRDRTGESVYIDSSGADALVALRASDTVMFWNRERITKTESYPNVGDRKNPKYAYYETKDHRFVVFAAAETKFWRRFCAAIGREDLLACHDLDSSLDWSDGGNPNLAVELRQLFHSRTLEEWMVLALENDIAIGPVNGTADLLDDDHLRSREIVYESIHPHAGPFTTVGWPAPVSGQPFAIEREAPLVGEHTDEILGEIGLAPSDIESLRASGVV